MTVLLPPAGVYPAVTWDPFPGIAFAEATVPPAILADDIGPDGEIRSLATGVHPVDAAIREAFRLFADTGAAVVGKGQRFRDIRKNDAAAARRIKDEANRILAPFVARLDIQVIELTVDTTLANDLGALFLRYKNLRTGQEQRLPAT